MLLRALAHSDVADGRVTRMPSSLSSGLSMISMGNRSVLAPPVEFNPGADLLRQRLGRVRVPSAINRSAKPPE